MSRAAALLTLGVVLFVGAGLRAPGLTWGQHAFDGPTRALWWNVDEATHTDVAAQFLDGNIDYAYHYVKGFGTHIAIAGLVGRALGVEPHAAFLRAAGRWISWAYGLGLIALLYAGCVIVTGDRRLGLLAATILSLCSLAVTQSHFATSDTASVLWTWATALLAWRFLRTGSDAALAATFAACGVACALKPNLAALGPLIVIVACGRMPLTRAVAGAGLAFAVFLLANGLGLGLDGLVATGKRILFDSVDVVPSHAAAETVATLVVSLLPAFSLPLLLAAGIGAASLRSAASRDRAAAMCLAAPPIVHGLLLCAIDDPFERHLLLFAPPLCALAAAGWMRMGAAFAGATARVAWSLPFVAYLALFAVDGERPFWSDTRVTARQWILDNVSPGSRVLVGPYARMDLPRTRYRLAHLRLMDDRVVAPADLDAIVLHESHTYRYGRSRLSPFWAPVPDAVFHADAFASAHLAALRAGETPLQLVDTPAAFVPWTLEARLYKQIWGTFPSFVGDCSIYARPERLLPGDGRSPRAIAPGLALGPRTDTPRD